MSETHDVEFLTELLNNLTIGPIRAALEKINPAQLRLIRTAADMIIGDAVERANMKVLITRAPTNKIGCIKAWREQTGLGLREAMSAVDSGRFAPMSAEQAEALVRGVKENGGDAEIRVMVKIDATWSSLTNTRRR